MGPSFFLTAAPTAKEDTTNRGSVPFILPLFFFAHLFTLYLNIIKYGREYRGAKCLKT